MKTLGNLVVFVVLLSLLAVARSAQKPNIIIIVADDMVSEFHKLFGSYLDH